MNWCFATINNRLGEIYFEKKNNGQVKFLGHCYVKRGDFKNKQELKWLDSDSKKSKIVYKNKKYKIIK